MLLFYFILFLLFIPIFYIFQDILSSPRWIQFEFIILSHEFQFYFLVPDDVVSI